jgi:anti-sigma regulatory factor (Ser/Thr protein kinase)
MTPMAPTRPTRSASPPLPVGQHQCRIPLRANLSAAAAARTAIEDAIRAWHVPVDADVAVLLASELVANAVKHGAPVSATCILLTIASDAAGLRVDVHDGSADLPVLENKNPAEAETGRGLLLVTTLSAEWGFYRTPAGKAVYFTLAFPCDGCPDAGDELLRPGNGRSTGQTGRAG